MNSPWFEYVKTKTKIYEGRCNWKQAAQYKIGDFLCIKHHTNLLESEFTVKIIDILKFDTFEIALRQLGLSQVLPNVETIEQGVEIYLKYYKLSTQLENGILMIKMVF